MKAIISREYGPPQSLRLGEVPRPEPGAEDCLVEVKASSVNPVDYKILAGKFKLLTGKKPPLIIGGDFAGVVREAGEASAFVPGEEVYGLTNYFKGGAFAEFLVAGPQQMAHKPKNLSFAEAAALPLTGQTALRALLQLGRLEKGERVLINGCSGGVGVLALQIAKAKGALITGVCSRANFDLGEQLGAAELIDYHNTPLHEQLGEFDLIFDCAGSLPFGLAAPHLGHGGRHVSTQASGLGMFWYPLRNLFSGKKRMQVMVESRRLDLTELTTWAESGDLRPIIAGTYPFAEAIGALEACRIGHSRGKQVLVWD